MELYIAEKKSAAEAIAACIPGKKVAKSGYISIDDDRIIVSYAAGHLLESKKPKAIDPRWAKWQMSSLPIMPYPLPSQPADFGNKKAQLAVLKELIKRAATIVNAGDAGREGELIFWEIIDHFNAHKKVVKRLWLSTFVESDIRKALSAMRPAADYFGLRDASYGRQTVDYWMGMTLTCAWTLAGAGAAGDKSQVANVGRVMTPTMSLVVKRDLLIEKFKPTDHFAVIGDFTHSVVGFSAKWQPNKDKVALNPQGFLLDKSVAEKVAAKCTGRPATVVSSKAEPKRELAPLPFSLPSLQSAANARYGFSAAKTLEIMQSLYEDKVLSYPRTDYDHLTVAMLKDVPSMLSTLSASAPHLAALVAKCNSKARHAAFNDAKIGDHHAIAPTLEKANFSRMGEDKQKIFDLVARRFIALFLPDHEFKAMVLELECEGERFRATGKKPVVLGWKEALGKAVDDTEEPEPVLPEVATGVKLTCKKASVKAQKTTPPARYTEGTLLDDMRAVHRLVDDPALKAKLKETAGLGTGATRAETLEKLFREDFMTRKGKQVISTPKARAMYKALPKDLTEPGMTALFEQELSAVADGKRTLDSFLDAMRRFVLKQLDLAKAADDAYAGAWACPKCKCNRLRRKSKKTGGYFWSCEGYPTCDAATSDVDGKPDLAELTRKLAKK